MYLSVYISVGVCVGVCVCVLEVKISSTSATRQAFVSTLECSPLRDNDVVLDLNDLKSIL